MPTDDDDDAVIIIRGGRVRVQREGLTVDEINVLDELALKGDQPLCRSERYALTVIIDRIACRP